MIFKIIFLKIKMKRKNEIDCNFGKKIKLDDYKMELETFNYLMEIGMCSKNNLKTIEHVYDCYNICYFTNDPDTLKMINYYKINKNLLLNIN